MDTQKGIYFKELTSHGKKIFRYKLVKHNYNFRFSMGKWVSDPSPMQQKQLRFSTNEETNKNHRTENSIPQNSRLYRRGGDHYIINSARLLFCSQCNIIVLDGPSNLKLSSKNTCVPSASHISFMLLDLFQFGLQVVIPSYQ